MTVVDTSSILNEVLGLLRADLHATQAALDVKPLPLVFADRVGVAQVFQNLVANALKYTEGRRPEIQIRAIEQEFHWRFEIQDNGMGIPQEKQKAAFDTFARFHGSKAPEGTGLGLPICKRIIEAHGGAIWLKSEVDVGTTFYFTLPKSQDVPIQKH
jgi:two-component system, sensor histidine kinase and response regulator